MPSSKTYPTAQPFLPERLSLASLKEAAAHCQGCDLYQGAAQTVFGQGKAHARVMLVGETPGDAEDKQGKPFVGPAGHLLREAMDEAGIDPADAYLTNAVKHFRYEMRGQRRLHKKPRWREIMACQPWLEAEVAVIGPELIVCLGATAAQSILGKDFRITKQRGELLVSDWAPWVVATWHPSAVLRAPDSESRQRMRGELVDDLRHGLSKLAG